jgi:hypothetical protein
MPVIPSPKPPHTYNRSRDLPKLLPLWPADAAALASHCPRAKRLVVARLHTALRAERRRGQCGHWAYDLNRHLALKAAYLAETAAPCRRSETALTVLQSMPLAATTGASQRAQARPVSSTDRKP